MEGNPASCKGKDATVSEVVKDLLEKFVKLPVSVCISVWKLGRENPRRVIHALKVGLALTLVSLLYLLEPLYEGFGQNAMWAVMTVVVVLEYTTGATLCKGLNRGLGTICAGLLAFFIEEVAEESGKVFKAAFIGGSVFVVGFAATYVSYRVQDIVGLARDRFYTIAIGCSICLIMSLLILPNWSGEDLHNSTVYKLDSLAKSIDACVEEYFQDEVIKSTEDRAPYDLIDKGYRTVLDSKSSDESLAQFASWEPRCTRRFHRYPWKQYVKLGAVLRHLGYTAVALHGCLDSQIQAPRSIRTLFRHPCTRVAQEASKVLAELANSLKDCHRFSPGMLRDHLHDALQDLNSSIKSQPRLFLGSNSTNAMKLDRKYEKGTTTEVTLHSVKSDASALSECSKAQKQLRPTLSKVALSSLEFSEALPFAAFSSLLVEMVARLDLVIEEADKLGKAANFKEFSGRNDLAIDLSYKCKGGIENSKELHNHHVVCQATE